MISFKAWQTGQIVNESAGRFNLGLKTPRSIGVSGSKLSEMGFPPKGDVPEEEEEADDNQDPNLDLGDDLGGDDIGNAPNEDPDGSEYDLSDIDPHLLALLGIKLGDDVGLGQDGSSGLDMGGDQDDISGIEDDLGGDPGMDSQDGGEDIHAMFGDLDNDSDEEGDEQNFPPKSQGSPFPPSDDDTDEDDISSDDQEEDEEDNDEEEDNEEEAPKFMKKGAEYNKKHMKKDGKSFMCGGCNNEDSSFLNSLVNNGRGENNRVWDSGMPGMPGFAPQGKVGGVR